MVGWVTWRGLTAPGHHPKSPGLHVDWPRRRLPTGQGVPMTFSSRPLSKLAALAPVSRSPSLSVGFGLERLRRQAHRPRLLPGRRRTPAARVRPERRATHQRLRPSSVPTRDLASRPAADQNADDDGPRSAPPGCSSDDWLLRRRDVHAADQASPQCKTGFTCIVAATVGNFCCERLCVCQRLHRHDPRRLQRDAHRSASPARPPAPTSALIARFAQLRGRGFAPLADSPRFAKASRASEAGPPHFLDPLAALALTLPDFPDSP